MRITYTTILLLLLITSLSATLSAQPATPHVIESGEFVLHKFLQPIGRESYSIARSGDTLSLASAFSFTDRGTDVSLNATMRMREDLTPFFFRVKGRTSRHSEIDRTIEVSSDRATITDGASRTDVNVTRRHFLAAGYAPISTQMLLLRYHRRHRIGSDSLQVPGVGHVRIEHRGFDTVPSSNGRTILDRYSVAGLIWGRETLWSDSTGTLVAAVTIDAEFDHLEAIRKGYERWLPFFVERAASDGMQILSELGALLSPARTGATAITNCVLVDGTGRPAVENATVVVERGKIIAVGPSSQVAVPAEAHVIDARGMTLLPGLWDMHAHFEQVEWGPLYLAAGITTVRDCGNELEFIASVRNAIRDGQGLGPRLLLAGVIDGHSTNALGVVRAGNRKEAHDAVTRYKNAGFDQIKIYSSVKPEVVPMICAEAHAAGLTVTGHVPNGMTTREAIEMGIDQINHIQYLPSLMISPHARSRAGEPLTVDFDSAAAKEGIRLLKEHATIIDPTLALYELIYRSKDIPASSVEPGIEHVYPALRHSLTNTGISPSRSGYMKKTVEGWLEVVGALHRAGIPIVAGTDQAVPGHSLYRELELYVEAGFTPMEAIQAATIVPARAMKLDAESGTIERGKRADMILVDGNPLRTIGDIRNVRIVVANGRVYESAPLWRSIGFTP